VIARGTRAAAAMALAAVGLVLAGCSRQPPRFVPPGADSAATAAADSFAAAVGNARDQWESGAGADVAATTARLLVRDLRAHAGSSIAERSRTLLDSCGFSGEVAGGADLAAVNFFARSDPAGGAWPYLVWRDGDAVSLQALEATGMRLLDLAARGGASSGSANAEAPQVAAIFGRTSSRGQQPVVIVWGHPPNRATWSLTQTLGRDSLGGIGVAEFAPHPDGPPGLEARTFRPSPGFDECATCPHVYHTLHFEWRSDGFRKTGEEAAASPYYSFVQMIGALAVGDRDLAQRFVADPSLLDTAMGYDWGKSKGLWRVAPGADESAEEMTFFRGTKEAYKVRFAMRGGEWVMTDLQPTQRSLE